MSDTLAASELGQTLIKDPSGPISSEGTALSTTLNTVLPQVEWEGDRPKVVASKRTRFEVLRELGRGGMGEVLLARDNDIDRLVALKRLPGSDEVGRVLRFIDEIRTVGRLEHPNITPVHDVGVDQQGRYYFVMKHVEGETLEEVINRLKAGDVAAHEKYPFPERVKIFTGILNAMAYAHQQGFLHRDLKPANIMVGPHGEVTVMDWGLARQFRDARAPLSLEDSGACVLHAIGPGQSAGIPPPPPSAPSSPVRHHSLQMTQVGSVMGTPLYMSPEQARGEHDSCDERSDIFSLAVIFYEFLNLKHYLGHCTTRDEVLKGVQETAAPLLMTDVHPLQGGIPAELAWFLDLGLQKDASRRFQSVEAMLLGLQNIARGKVRVQCHRTAMKRSLFEVANALDRHPVLMTIAPGLTVVALIAVAMRVGAWLSTS